MKSIEQRGKSVEEAIEQALTQLGVSRDQVEVVVLEEQKGGLFGLLSQPSALVRVTVKAGEAAVESQPPSSPVQTPEEPAAPETAAPGAPTAEEARALVQSILDKMEVEATATFVSLSEASESRGREIQIDLVGEDVGILIGKYGKTLYALQYIINVILNKSHLNPLKVLLDAQGYRQRREESLKSIARNAAARAVRQGRQVKLEPLPVHERRIIHLTLQDDKSVFTYSEGEEPHRYVIVAPAEEGSPRRTERPQRDREGFGRRGSRPPTRRYASHDSREWDEAWAQLEREKKAEGGEEDKQ